MSEEAGMDGIAQEEGQAVRVAAIYARVSSERQREEGTIESQVAGLRELAQDRGLVVPVELEFLDEGFSGATLLRPALERLRDRAAEGCFEVVLCHCPDRLARRYAYQVLLLEELERAGVEVVFAREGERSGSPEDELLRQFQGMIAEYERAQIRERTRRGKLHRARQGSQAVLVCAPFGYRYLRKTDQADGYFQVDPAEAEVVREVFRRYTEQGESMAEIARALSASSVPTRTGKAVWDRSTVWGMLRNPAYRGEAAFGKTQTSGQRAKPTRRARARGERHGRRETRRDQPPESWTLVPVPALVSGQTFELAQARLQENKRFATRNTKQPTLLQGILVCRECGYACYRTSTRTSCRRIYYYRCIGSDNYRHVGGRVCQSRPIRADELDELVWAEVRRLLEQPELVRAEIERRLEAVRSEHPAARRREGLEHELARVRAGTGRLIEAYQEQLIALEELRERMPKLRKRESTLTAQLVALEGELHDAETYLKLAETLEGFLGRLTDGLDELTVHEQQRVLRLVVREVLIGGEQDNVTIRHSIPTPNGDGSPGCPLRGSSHHPALRRTTHTAPDRASSITPARSKARSSLRIWRSTIRSSVACINRSCGIASKQLAMSVSTTQRRPR
jgi:site-specific DNA recombinase